MKSQELKEIMLKNCISFSALGKELDMPNWRVRLLVKKPIQGKVYDPNDLNYDEFIAYCESKNIDLDLIDYDKLAHLCRRKKEVKMPELGKEINIDGIHFTVVYTSSNSVCLEDRNGHLRAMSLERFGKYDN